MADGVLKIRVGGAWQSVPTLGPVGPVGPQGPQGIQGESGATAAHHVNHEPGGSDQIVKLTLTSAHPQLTLEPGAAGIPLIAFNNLTDPVDARKWRVYVNAQLFRIDCQNDAVTGTLSVPLSIARNGDTTVGGNLLKINASGNAAVGLYSSVATTGNRYSKWQANTDGGVNLYMLDDADTAVVSVPISCTRAGNVTLGSSATVAQSLNVGTHFLAHGNIRSESPRGSPPGLVGGGIELFFQGGAGYVHTWDMNTSGYTPLHLYATDIYVSRPGSTLTVYGDINAGTDANKGNIYSTYPIYPGRQDTGWTKQTSWYLGSHPSYGLWSNTGLYLGSSLYCTYVIARNNIHTGNGAYVYPGRVDVGDGNTQGSWLLASHGSYGMYINTGLYLVGGLWTENINCRTSISCQAINTNGYRVTCGPITCNDSLTLASNVWHNSSDGYQRLYYGGGGSTYIKSPTNIVFRTNNTDTDNTNINANGGITSNWGYACRAGVWGPQGGNWFNFNWSGVLDAWVDATYLGAVAMSSDARIKRDFTPLVNSLDKVLQMRPGTFYYLPIKEDAEPDSYMHLGLKAQDVMSIAPELVRKTNMETPLTPDGMFQINYLEMIPMLVAAIQELDQRVTDLREDTHG